jgi:protein arginine kinase activator
MKCENCGKNEVTFVYQSNLNGQVTEKHLCSECARKLGYTQAVAAQSRRMMQGMQSFFSNPFGSFGGGLLDSFFSPAPLLGDGSGRFFGEDLFDDFFADLPALGAPEAEQGEPEAASQAEQPQAEQPSGQDVREPRRNRREIPISEEDQSRISRQRELNALRLELKRAVHQENFEQAAQLRDQIRALEQDRRDGER